jgi:hypothetical protein
MCLVRSWLLCLKVIDHIGRIITTVVHLNIWELDFLQSLICHILLNASVTLVPILIRLNSAKIDFSSRAAHIRRTNC